MHSSVCGHTEAFSEIPKGIQAERLGRGQGSGRGKKRKTGEEGRVIGRGGDGDGSETRVQGKIRGESRMELSGSAV